MSKRGEVIEAIVRLLGDPKMPDLSYRGGHTAPVDPEYHSPIHNLTEAGTYPADVYGPNGLRYYGGGPEDKEAFDILNRLKGQPEEMVDIYRAVPGDAPDEILPGDWVTTTENYARQHGEYFDDPKILRGSVPAKKLRTDGNSPHEFGYTGNARPDLLATMAGVGGAAAMAPWLLDGGPSGDQIKAPAHPKMQALADVLINAGHSIEGSPAELVFNPRPVGRWLSKLAYGDKPTAADRLAVGAEFL